jgi:nucleotide-binding universal stress UspA family protein
MRKILLPTDFSNNALNAINYALELFKNEKCIFYFLNTYSPAIYSYEYQISSNLYMKDIIDEIKKQSEDKLEKIASDVNKKFNNSNHEFKILTAYNTLYNEIKKLLDTYNFDLIVMGTKGASGIKEVLFGSNTVQIIKKAKCPVLAIPSEYKFVKPTQILFPTDYKIDYTDYHLGILKNLANIYKSQVHILNVSSGKLPSAVEKRNEEKLNNLLSNVNDAYYKFEYQEIPKAIGEFMELNEIHLLMMIKNKHTFLENLFIKPVIHQIGFKLTIPFLVIPLKM